MFRYYPDISLLFRHNLAEVETVESQESVNSDLTLNKSVTITAVSSDEPYTFCVTSNVPGSSLNEYMTTVFVTENRDSTTVGATVPHNEEQNNNSQQELLIGKQYHLSIERCSSKCGFLCTIYIIYFVIKINTYTSRSNTNLDMAVTHRDSLRMD